MATRPNDVRMTLAEFLAWDDGTDTVYELINGQIFAMTAPHWRHARVLSRLDRRIGAAIEPPCEVFTTGGVVPLEVDDTWLVPDLVVSCAEQDEADRHIREPKLIVEVVSPSSHDHDRGRKVDLYRRIASVEEILVVWSRERRVELWRRDGRRWVVEDFVGNAAFRLETLSATLGLADIYGD